MSEKNKMVSGAQLLAVQDLVLRQALTADGVTSRDIMVAARCKLGPASTVFAVLRRRRPDLKFEWARHSNEKAKHWFLSAELAEAYRARDPLIRVLHNRTGVRIVVGKKAIDVPSFAVRHVAQQMMPEVVS
jgi:hypothetical protein